MVRARRLGARRATARVVLGAVLAGSMALANERAAFACGGCFTPPPPPSEVLSVITDEKMILSISMAQTTLYDQIRYSGSPSSFAWVLPIKGTVTVGLSADVLFQVIDQLTATQVLEPPTNCPPPPEHCGGFAAYGAYSGGDAGASGTDAGGSVMVLSQTQVGPYETVQLHSTDGSALTSWLTSHGYQIPASTKPIIDAYVAASFDFLALKLVPGVGVQSMQPVRVTSAGAAPSLPLRMVAVGTGPTTGITVWVVADARWEPSNFPTFTIADSEIAWDWATSSSNYESLRLAKEAKLGGKGWQIESSLSLNQGTVQGTLISNVQYEQAGGYLPLPVPDGGAPSGDAGAVDGGYGEGGYVDSTAQVAAASADLAILFNGVAQPNARITRMRSDVAHSALSADMTLGAATDPSELSNIHNPVQQIGEPLCPVYDPETCAQTGTAPREATGVGSGGGSAETPAGGGGCSTTRPQGDGQVTLGALLAFAGLTAFGVDRKRRRRPRGG